VRQLSFVTKGLNTKLERVEIRSRANPSAIFNNLGHVLDLDLLRTCFHSLDAKKAVGVDKITKEMYGIKLETKLAHLLKRIRNQSYYPKPARIVEIPKVDGSTRPLAISCIEDKIVQEAVRRILEQIFEPHFLDCSYGFRPGRNAHQALASLGTRLLEKNCWMAVDVDLKKYFNTIPHRHLGKILQTKVKDKRFLYLIIKLLKAPTLNQDGAIKQNEVGSPQGSILSPLLANIYLHYVLDVWFKKLNEETLKCEGHMVRYADDVLFTFDSTKSAKLFHAKLIERLTAFGLEVNAEKTKIISCGTKLAAKYAELGKRMPTFAFLGFLHVWGQSFNRKQGISFWRIKRRTDPKRFRKKLAEVRSHLIKHRHDKELIPYAISVVRGYTRYFAVNDNSARVKKFLHVVRRFLFEALNRRSNKKSYNWTRFQAILDQSRYPKEVPMVNLYFKSSDYRPR
jgi:RNA-directed DNA polymerase